MAVWTMLIGCYCVQIMDATRARTKAQLSAGSHVSAKFASMELAAARGTHLGGIDTCIRVDGREERGDGI